METLILYCVAAACVGYVLFSTIRLRRVLFADPFHPRLVYRILILYTLVFSAFSSANSEEFHFITKLTVLCVALFFLVSLDLIGIIFPNKRGNQSLPESSRDDFFAKSFLWIYIAGWVWRAYAIQAGLLYGTFLATQLEVSDFGNIAGQLNGLSSLALMGRIIFFRGDGLRKRDFLLIFAEICWAFMSGSKIAILYVIIPLLLIAYRRSWLRITLQRLVFGGLLALVVVQFSFGLVTAYRIGVQQSVSGGVGLGVSSLLEGFSTAITGNSEPLPDSVGGVSERLNWASFFGALVERQDLWRDSWWGDSYLPVFTWWIPRFLWPDKPTVSVGAWYGEQVLGWSFDSRSEGAITIWGDGLMNFGQIGIFASSLMWIFLVYFFYQRLGGKGRWGLLFLSMIYVRLLLGLEQNAAAPLVALQMQFIAILLVRMVLLTLAFFFDRKLGS
mgnify:CR=1 FL=1